MMESMQALKSDRTSLVIVFITALAFRLAFSFYFQQYYFGSFEFKYGDGDSYLNPIINLISAGEYRGDRFLEDSKYFRVPVYPLFLGLIRLISSEDMFPYAVASIQCVIGAISAVLVYCIIFNISQVNKAALISGFIFAAYPFSILWTPLVYTETLQIFLMFSLLCLTTGGKINTLSIAMQGIIVGLIVLTKQYLGLIIIIPICIILFVRTLTWRKKIGYLFALIISIVMVLSPWAVRNYISSGKIIVLFGETSGLRNALDDMVVFTRFANKFNEDITESVRSVANTGKVNFSRHLDFVARHKVDIDSAVFLAYQCGGSFQEWRQHTSLWQPPYQNCNEAVVSRFNNLSEQFWKEVPFWEAMESRRDSLSKIVLKSTLTNDSKILSKDDFFKYILFKYRIFMLGLGFVGLLFLLTKESVQYEQKVLLGSLLVTALGFYLFFCLILVQAEMRYLLTPDLLISMFSGLIIAKVLRQFGTGTLIGRERAH